MSRFKFDTLSPDDAILEAQKRATGSAEPNAVHQKPQQYGAPSRPTQNEATPTINNGELLGHRALMHVLLQTVLYAFVITSHVMNKQITTSPRLINVQYTADSLVL